MKMNQLCDFCKEQRSMIYCKSDAAYLCLSCDRTIHSANGISKRHSRSLVCERCNSQIATVRCIEEKLSLCQNCDWSELSTSDSLTKHKWETISSYSGCPSAAELSRIWSFFCFDQSTCGSEAVVIIVEEAVMDTTEFDVEQFDGIESLNTPNPKDFSDLDIDWSMENCEALFGESTDNPQQFFDNGGFDNLFGTEMSCDTERSEDCRHDEACRNPISADTDPNICFSPRPVQSCFSISFPDQTAGQETAVDQQNEGVSSSVLVIIDEQPPCIDHHLETRLTSSIRDCAVLRYKEKRKSRKFDGKVRYASRKAGAEVRKRVKGRFVKAGDPYDYDPLDLTKDFTLPKVLL